MFEPQDLQPESWMVVGGRDHRVGQPLHTPLVLASNFAKSGSASAGGSVRKYAREDGSPTWEAFEHIVGGLEGGEAVAFSSGMAAVAAVFDMLPVGAQVALPADCYQGVVRLAEQQRALGRLSITRLNIDDPSAWLAAGQSMDLLWLESPTNPMLVVADLPMILAGPRTRGCLAVVDNTFATPFNQQPLRMGADIVVHSATKLLGGHSDLLAGVVVSSDDTLFQTLREMRTIHGATPGTLEMYLATRGMRTLALRLAQAQANAMTLAERLEQHPQVERVRYPGLPGHPTHAIAARTMRGFGTIVSFETGGGSNDQDRAARADAVCSRLRLIRHATSLGGVESTIERRAALAGQAHVPSSLLRFSVGCEHVEDLWRDLETALTQG